MAIMVPDTIRDSTVSRGERRLFQRFRNELPDTCYVLHSLGLTNHKGKLWAECDFVVLSPDGIFILEVKSGGVDCRDGKWVFTRSDGTEFTKTEGPFEQAKGAMYAVKEKVDADRNLRGLVTGYGVIMPDDDFPHDGPEIERGVLLRKRDFSSPLGGYIQHLGKFWHQKVLDKHGRNARFPSKPEKEAVRKILRPEIRTALTLNSSLASLESQQVELTEEQCRILQRLANNPRTVVSGGAGTGKTILAVDKAAKYAEKGCRVLYLCFNKLLGRHVQEAIDNLEQDFGGRLQAFSIHAWYNKIIDEAGSDRPKRGEGDSVDFFKEAYSGAYIDALLKLEMEPFDVLIIDEGQDLLCREHLDAFDLTLHKGLDGGQWHVFMDPLQNIFQQDDKQVLAELKRYGYAEFGLEVNCRNTREVAVLTSLVSGIPVPLDMAVEGGRQEVVFLKNSDDVAGELENRIQRAIDGGVAKRDIVILSRFRLENSALSETSQLAGSAICDLTRGPSRRGTIDFCTIQGFKGLERKVVFVLDVQDLQDEEVRLLHYCGLSRARTVLTVFLPAEEKDSYNKMCVEFGHLIAKREL